MTQQLYQELYDRKDIHYGDHDHDRCPAMRYWPLYSKYVRYPLIDVGCGRGQIVRELVRKSAEAYGIDWIKQDTANGHITIGDITKLKDLSKYQTALCIDVLEHLNEKDIVKVLKALKTAKSCVIMIYSGSAKEPGCEEELHITNKPIEWWDKLMQKHLGTTTQNRIDEYRKLYIIEGL